MYFLYLLDSYVDEVLSIGMETASIILNEIIKRKLNFILYFLSQVLLFFLSIYPNMILL